ncbi:deoxyguanosinetriphosphate triphosphohydrolase [Euzebya tangerina]|uniref:deoxyguanosinetriphosphate triphosphohydrolase n=1 Tax=Euzebya tangerina TaxID=591198 RepID=UPI0013C353C9|nr:deoxyguanosinetriphosphate triphosphohydrolase [Euzebya tangerina]
MPDPRSARERTEELERASLSAWATLSDESKGREQPEAADRLRTSFQIDIERIQGCGAFGRLTDKSHSLLSVRGAGYRSRLQHTLSGARTARTIARALRLNEDLTEAIALGRELGAPAFGRAGEAALGLFTEPAFRHNHQSVRIIETLEPGPAGTPGLNLSFEVRDGIACHTSDAPTPATREAEVVRVSARIAQVIDEITDALETGVVVLSDLPAEAIGSLGDQPTSWRGVLTEDVVAASAGRPEIALGEPAQSALDTLVDFIVDRVADGHARADEQGRGSHVLSSLVVFYRDNPDRLPAAFRHTNDPLDVRIIDGVASLSDRQAVQQFNQFFLPQQTPRLS